MNIQYIKDVICDIFDIKQDNYKMFYLNLMVTTKKEQ